MNKTIPFLLAILILASCQQKSEKCECPVCPELPKVQQPEVVKKPTLELIPAGFDELPSWKRDDFSESIPVFAANCKKIAHMKGEHIGNSKVKIQTKAYQNICKKFFVKDIKTSEQFRVFLEQNFEPHLVTDNGNSEGKITSYYEAEIYASRKKHGKYQYPIYGKPDSLIEVNLQDFDKALPSRRLTGRVEGQKFIPYHTRADIENKPFEAPVILWSDSYIDIYVMQIQGSAVAKMDDGSKLRVGYADNNGHAFKGIGSILQSKKLLEPGKASMLHIKEWMKNNPDTALKHAQENQRFIFHRLIEGEGPIGAFGLPLTAGRSMAVDRDIIPLGTMLWLDTTSPEGKKPMQKLVSAQDVGSAIKGVVRGDYFWGSGGDEVLRLAGSMNTPGRYFILIPRE